MGEIWGRYRRDELLDDRLARLQIELVGEARRAQLVLQLAISAARELGAALVDGVEELERCADRVADRQPDERTESAVVLDRPMRTAVAVTGGAKVTQDESASRCVESVQRRVLKQRELVSNVRLHAIALPSEPLRARSRSQRKSSSVPRFTGDQRCHVRKRKCCERLSHRCFTS